MKQRSHNWMDFLAIYGTGMVLVLTGFYFAYTFVEPAPPKKITIASGQPGGAYFQYAKRYAGALEREGITLKVRDTAGSVENLKLLMDGEVDIAFVQGGTIPKPVPGMLEGLGSLYYEPLWLFHNKQINLNRLGRLEKLKVAIGPEGSGTQALVKDLLAENRLPDTKIQIWTLDTTATMDALGRGDIDAAFFVTRASSPLVKQLITKDNLTIASFDRAGAYAKRFPYLSTVVLPEGSHDLPDNIPNKNVRLLATTASLAVRKDLHPAIVDLIMQAADQVHQDGGWFEERGEFPSPKYLELPLNDEANRYYKYGPPLLQRYLPFWAASMVDRLKIMLLPLVALMLPLFKLLPPLYRWRMRSRILKIYDQLDTLDPDIWQIKQLSTEEIAFRLEKLDELDRAVHNLKVPVAFSDRLYHLRHHIQLVKQSLLNHSTGID